MSRLHLGVDINDAEGRSALVAVEHQETAPDEPSGKPGLRHLVSYQQRWPLGTPLEVVRDDLKAVTVELAASPPVLLVNTAGAGEALFRALKREKALAEGTKLYGYALHGGRSGQGGGIRRGRLQTAVVEAYLRGRLAFAEGLPLVEEMAEALVKGVPAIDADGRSSLKLDDLAVALGLAMAFPTYGKAMRFVGKSGRVWESRAYADGLDAAYAPRSTGVK